MPLNFDDGDAGQALDQQQHTDRWQFGVIDGCAVSPGTNDLTVQCDAGTVIFDGGAEAVAAQDNVALATADATHPRKDTVWIDGTGTLQVTTGTAEEPVPAGYDHWRAYRPAPPDLSATNAVVLAEVWVPAGATDITAGDIRDRRQLAHLAVGTFAGARIVTPTGTNDAQAVQHAIDTRTGTEAVVLPDPGFALDWDQQVDLPASEGGFSLVTLGQPTLDIPADFTGSYAIFKPAAPNSMNESVQNYYLGGVEIDDRANGLLTEAIRLNDIKQGVVDSPLIRGAAGVRIRSPNHSSTMNRLLHVRVLDGPGPAVALARNVEPTNGTLVIMPSYNSDTVGAGTAFLDEGDFNQWLWTHAEQAGVVHDMDGASRYRILESDWDRQADYTHTVKESNGALGYISVRGRQTAQKLRLCSAATVVESLPGAFNFQGYHDVFERIAGMLAGDRVGAGTTTLGIEDNSSGGASTSVMPWGARGALNLNTGATSGDRAELSTGKNFNPDRHAPALFWPMQPDAAGDTSGVLIRVGLINGGDHADMIFDPGNVLGGHTTGNWYFQLTTGGVQRANIDTGIAPAAGAANRLGIQREDGGADATWSAHIDEGLVATASNAGTSLGNCWFRCAVETREAVAHQWNVFVEHHPSLQIF